MTTALSDVSPFDRGVWTEKQYQKMNHAFHRAMMTAIALKLEHTPVGVVTAPCTDNPVIYFRPAVRSYCSSPAGTVADLAPSRRYDPDLARPHA